MNSLLTVPELSQLLKISKDTIYRWVHEGYLPHLKMGGAVRFKERDIEVWLAKRANKGRKARRIDVDAL